MTIMFVSITITKIGGIPATLFIAMDKEKVMILSRTIFGISNIVLSIVLIPKYGAIGSVISSSVAGVSGIIYESVVLHKLLCPSYPIDFLWKIICASVIMGVIIYLLKPLLFALSDYIGLFLAILTGVIIYGFLVIKLKPISNEVIDLFSTTKIPFKDKVIKILR
jgi:O-antigen/teichoic acid export membrane protein